jgi:hypothetical protein
MKKLVCTALVAALLFCVFPFFSSVHASTTAGGILTSDTTWTTAQSPIQLTSSVCVGRGVTLTIEPGVTVDLGQYYILVNGTLNAKGTSGNNIFFTDSTLSDNSPNRKPQIEFTSISADSIIENVNLYYQNFMVTKATRLAYISLAISSLAFLLTVIQQLLPFV